MSRLFEKLAAKERDFRHREFLSPVLRGGFIRIRIAGVMMKLKVNQPRDFQGWGIFQPLDFHRARVVRKPTLKQRKNYLELFPSVRLIVCRKKKSTWFGTPLRPADSRFGLDRDTDIGLAENCELFDRVIARFDGCRYWFDRHDPRSSRKQAQSLREQLLLGSDPQFVDFRGCPKTLRDVYEFALLRKLDNERDPDEVRLQKAVAHGGGEYQSHREVGDYFSVTFKVDGESFTSTVGKVDLQVDSSGICLDGYDDRFDLHSLVGVLREGQQTGQIDRY